MPTFSREELEEVAFAILQGAGAGAEPARIVAVELADANLVGHDSHGIIRLKQYVNSIQRGNIKPGAEIQVVVDQPGATVLDGGFHFGQVVATRALEIALSGARSIGAHSVFCRNTNHVGRLGSFTRKAALDGCAAMMSVNSPGAFGVAPWGGLDRRLGTNPISIAAPGKDEPLVLDMTTSVAAEGKLRVACQAGQSVPEGWVVDAYGNSSTDPNDYYRGGAILPLGGPFGFKGYGLAVMFDVFCGILSGAGVARSDLPEGNNGVWLYLVDINRLIPRAEYDSWMEKYLAWLKSSRRADGVQEILVPGEVESQRAAARREQGITVPDATWQQTLDLAEQLGARLDVSR